MFLTRGRRSARGHPALVFERWSLLFGEIADEIVAAEIATLLSAATRAVR
jgi:hypothetical protein